MVVWELPLRTSVPNSIVSSMPASAKTNPTDSICQASPSLITTSVSYVPDGYAPMLQEIWFLSSGWVHSTSCTST